MSGHSKWATTKHKKAVVDAKRGKLFAKLIKNIEVAARTGGGDPAATRRCTTPSRRRKKSSVPNDNIDRAVKRGSGARGRRRRLADDHVRGLRPERRRRAHRVPDRQPQPRRLRGPHRDDPQRRLDGRPRLGVLPVQPQGRRHRARRTSSTEDDVLRAVLDAGAEEVNDLGEAFEVVSEADRPGRRARRRCRTPGSTTSRPTPSWCRACRSRWTRTAPARCFRLIDALEDSDDVQNVYANFDVSDEILEAVG